LSIDVEDWYHDTAVIRPSPVVPRVEENTLRLLDLLQQHAARATFFFLGEVAADFPALVRRVAGAGNEIGSHGYHHRPVSELTRREFRDDVARSLRVLEDVTGQPVCGYRAPYFWIKADVRWPLDILSELGVRYDASILAIDRPPGFELVCPRVPFRHPNGLWEAPVAVVRMCRIWHLPLASGAGLRLLPRPLLDRWLQRFEGEVGAGVFYLHPWELDPRSPTAPRLSRWFLRVGRTRLVDRLRLLLSEREFAPIAEVFAQLGAAAPRARPPAADLLS
jgi:polysaccharide deacetylase family protein (PEP-CTERM system associated)